MQINRLLSNSGWWILSILSLVPLVLWIIESPLGIRFSETSLILRSLGDISGLCGMAMFSLVMILSARLKVFERFFNGMNEAYMAHHIFGGLAFCLLLFHPLFLACNYLSVSFVAAAKFLLPGQNLALNLGIFGLLVMVITLVITFYTKLKYQVWKFTHKFLGLAFIFAFFHTFLIGGDIVTNQYLKTYLFILGISAIVLYFYRTIFAGYLVKTFDYTVKEVKALPDKIWEIELQPENKEIKFTAGQFAFIKIISERLTKESHPFSFISNPGSPLKIAVKELGDYTNKIGNLKVGDLAQIEGPFGSFNFKKFANKKQVWIAGGIGITPFLSMLRGFSDQDMDYKIDLYYSVKNDSCLVFSDEIEKIAQRFKNLRIIFWVSEKRGFLTGEAIGINTADLKERDILICGPGPMMGALEKQFILQGVKKNKIHAEEFKFY